MPIVVEFDLLPPDTRLRDHRWSLLQRSPRTVKPLEDHPSGDGRNLDNLSRTPRGGSAPGGCAPIFRNVALREWFIILGVIKESAMSEPIDLSAVPSRFLNPKEWAKLRAFAPNDLLALTYINAPYPDEENPGDFFWDRGGSIKDAVHCYNTGRSLLRHCRTLLSEGKLVATGLNSARRRQPISSREWLNLWPMFATNKAAGPSQVFDEVKVFEAKLLDTPQAQLSADCVAWLKERKITRSGAKKQVLFEDARQALDCALTHAIFDAAYLAVYGHGRGRPRKNTANS